MPGSPINKSQMSKEIIRAGQDCLKVHSKHEQCFVTSDGVPFLDINLARNHARSLENNEVTTVSRKGSSKSPEKDFFLTDEEKQNAKSSESDPRAKTEKAAKIKEQPSESKK